MSSELLARKISRFIKIYPWEIDISLPVREIYKITNEPYISRRQITLSNSYKVTYLQLVIF